MNQKQQVTPTHKCTDCLWCQGSLFLPCQGHCSMQPCCWIRSHLPAYQGEKQTVLQCSSRGYNVLFYMLHQFHRDPLVWSCHIGSSNAFGTAGDVRTSPAHTNLNEQEEYSHTYLPSVQEKLELENLRHFPKLLNCKGRTLLTRGRGLSIPGFPWVMINRLSVLCFNLVAYLMLTT